jgi:hypothetical protein
MAIWNRSIIYLVEPGLFLEGSEGIGSSARLLVVLLGQRALVPMRVVREVLWMPLGHCYSITWAFLRAFLKAFLSTASFT